ncbi:MAG TPA: Crp/Fnr family transcriptional regulator [Burkholderiales bacterium]|nr:Crp/Fnr family transcriptional regulator [Burkholderiales bacterium]
MASDLERVPLFEAIAQDELKALAANTATRTYPKHAIIVNEGDPGGSLYVLLAGRVKFFLMGSNGREFVLGTAGPGEYFGEIALDGGPRSASVMTLEPCRCSIVPREGLRAFVASHPTVALTIMNNLSRRVRALTETVKNLALSDVYGRVAHLLSEAGRDGHDEIALSQQAIADRVGASRQMVSRIITDLVAGGYVARRGRRIVVLRKPPSAW